MQTRIRFFIFTALCGTFFSSILYAQTTPEQWLEVCEELECLERTRAACLPPPTLYNYYGQIGYFQMPSARCKEEGTGAIGFSLVDPYDNYYASFQLFRFLELSGIYRVFTGIEDLNLSKFGFGDFSDKGVNAKFTLLHAQDTDYRFPSIAIGVDDFLGSCGFYAWYIVATQVLPKYNLELSLGYGIERMRGLFGGIAFSPFARSKDPVHKGLTLTAEYDCIDYSDPDSEPHPDGRTQKSKINWGFQYQLGPYLQLTASRLRGETWAGGATFNYNIGKTTGLFPKFMDPPLYSTPIDHDPMGEYRSLRAVVCQMGFTFDDQGFTLLEAAYYPACDVLRLYVSNDTYLKECVVHERIVAILTALIPQNLHRIDIVIVAESIPCQEYHFRHSDLIRYAKGLISPCELAILSRLREVPGSINHKCVPLYKNNDVLIDWIARPRLRTFFGSSTGKLKYAIDLIACFEGYFGPKIYYELVPGYTPLSNTQSLGSFDILNPSQLLNVNSDRILYYQARNIRLEQGFVQRAWNLGKGFYQRFGLGFFDIAYAGVAAEWLYYPLHSTWAVGLEGALLRKRNYCGFGFQDKIRRYSGYVAEYVPYVALFQGFLNVWWNPEHFPIAVKWSLGQFLARDIGLKTEVFRIFENGLRLSLWYTVTNGHDVINGSVYYDKGISFSIPLDIFLPKSTHTRLGYGMSAWLRDVGYCIEAGRPLYTTLSEERN